MIRYFFILLIMLFGSSIFGQNSTIEKGDDFFNKRMYQEAIIEYQKALNKINPSKKFFFTKRIAQTYKLLFDYEKANEWYQKLTEFNNPDEPIHQFDYAMILCNLEQYEKAKESFQSYFNAIGHPQDYNRYKEICDWAIEHQSYIENVAITKTNIETGGRSMGIDFFQKGLVFSLPQNRDFLTKTVFYDLAYTIRKDTGIFDSVNVLKGDLNHSFYEGTPSFTKDQKQLYYTGNASEVTKYRSKKLSTKNIQISKEGVNILYIYSTIFNGKEWSEGKKLPFNSKEYNCAFPFIFKNQRLYFSSDMPGGYGGYDLYYVDKLTDSTWTNPVNLGEKINTPLDEIYPYVCNDTLFFSSNGKKGFGGTDIHKSFINGDQFSETENLGKPFNSSKDDFSFIVNYNERRGFLSSNREGNHGYDFIYEFNIPEGPDTIIGTAINKITLKPIEGLEVKLYRVDQKGVPVYEKTFITNLDGKVELILDKHVEFVVTFYHPGFDPQTFEIPSENREDVLAKFGKILFMPIPKKDDIIKIDNIYFDYNKASIKQESFEVIDVILEYLKKNARIRVELSAHTDSRGSDAYNLRLSTRRAQSVVNYLIQKGIQKERLVPKGYGEKKLVNKCKNNVICTEEEHQENRRVELKVL